MRYTLKHRLIGAAVLAAIAVLFLPSFFKEKQVAPVSTKTLIPQRPGTVPVEFNAPQPVLGAEPAPAPEAMFAPDETGPQPAVASKDVAATSSVAVMPLNAQGLPDAWVVQVGSFSTKEAANKVRDDLQAGGFKAYVRTVPGGSGSISRVYIGPKLDKAQAQAIKGQVDKLMKVNSIVTHFQP
ncbi:MAG TPA: SPOR domain-containing protein [Cellvibrio sp.]|nr:SPOR domain-containing protein [Cellvibrio sp.]